MKQKELNKLIEKTLKDNPSLRKSLQVFNLSRKEYKEAIRSLSNRPTISSSQSTNYDGDMARD